MPAGSLRDDEMRAERCHPLWCSIKSPLTRAGEQRRGSPLAAPPGMLGKQGRAGRTGQPPAAGKGFWTLGKVGKARAGPALWWQWVKVWEGLCRVCWAGPSHGAP